MKIAKDQKKAKAEAMLERMKERLNKMKDVKIPEKKPRDPMLRNRLPMQTGPRKMSDRGPSRIMKPMPITPDLKRKLKDRDMKPLPITPKDRERMKDRIMQPLKAGGAAGQTKSTKRPMQSIFQQLKKAQMVRKHDGRGKK